MVARGRVVKFSVDFYVFCTTLKYLARVRTWFSTGNSTAIFIVFYLTTLELVVNIEYPFMKIKHSVVGGSSRVF
jgi:hypothetical protein